MEKKSLIVWMFVVVAMLSVVVSTAKGEKQIQQEQLEEIVKYISQQRRVIEDYYVGQLTELRLRAEADIRLLEAADIEVVFAGFAEWAELAETVLQINGYENEPYGYFEATTETSPKRLGVAQSRIAEKKNDILGSFGWAAVDLEKNRRYTLDVGLVKLEKQLKKNVLAAKPKTTYGVITGIVYSEENPSAIIDGQIVHEGDIIHGVKVVKIQRGEIGFEKNSKKWRQKVQGKPEEFWQ